MVWLRQPDDREHNTRQIDGPWFGTTQGRHGWQSVLGNLLWGNKRELYRSGKHAGDELEGAVITHIRDPQSTGCLRSTGCIWESVSLPQLDETYKLKDFTDTTLCLLRITAVKWEPFKLVCMLSPSNLKVF